MYVTYSSLGNIKRLFFKLLFAFYNYCRIQNACFFICFVYFFISFSDTTAILFLNVQNVLLYLDPVIIICLYLIRY